VTATTTTTITGVSVLNGSRPRHKHAFDMELSRAGIEIRMPPGPPRHLSWDRVSEWEVTARRGGVLLTLRGAGAETPLMVPGWTVDDLQAAMRDAVDGSAGVTDAAPPAPPAPAAPAADSFWTPRARVSATPVADAAAEAPVPARADRRRQAGRAKRTEKRSRWKVAAIAVLLVVLATAVTAVLLQSAGIIHWAFLGPTA